MTTSTRPTLSLKRSDASTAPALDERLHKVLANAGVLNAPSLLRRDGVWTGGRETRNSGSAAMGD